MAGMVLNNIPKFNSLKFSLLTIISLLYLYLRPKSKTASAPGSVPHTPVPSDDLIDMLQDRITLANTISTLENEAQDNNCTSTTTDNSVLPVGAEEMGSGKQCVHLTHGGRI